MLVDIVARMLCFSKVLVFSHPCTSRHSWWLLLLCLFFIDTIFFLHSIFACCCASLQTPYCYSSYLLALRLLYCMEYLLENLDWLQDHLEAYNEDEYLILDCPGQV